MSALTARVVAPGGFMRADRIIDGTLTPGVVRVMAGYYGIHCEACTWRVQRPVRFGAGHAHDIRRAHLKAAHGDALRSGAMVLDATLVA